MDRLSQGQLVAAISGVLLIFSMFLSWSGVSVPEVPSSLGVQTGSAPAIASDTTHNLWDGSTLAIYLLLTALLAIAPAVAELAGGRQDLPFAPASLLLGAVGVLLVLAFLTVDFPDGAERKIGAYVGLFAVAGVTVGSWMEMDEGLGDEH